MSLNKLDKEKIIDIIDFIITEDGCDPETFNEYMNDSYNGIEEFFNKIRTSKKVFDMHHEDVDFIFHVYVDNFDLIEDGELTVDNIELPEPVDSVVQTRCFVSKSGDEIYQQRGNWYSEHSVWWDYYMGHFYPNDGDLLDSDYNRYEMDEWEISEFRTLEKNTNESKEQRLKKLFMLKELVDKKIKEIL